MSYGAFSHRIEASFDPKDLIARFPTLKKTVETYLALLKFMDVPCHLNNYWLAYGEKAEDIVDGLECDTAYAEAWIEFSNKVYEETGLKVGLTYAPAAEDSYADVADEYVFFISNAYTRVRTPAFKKACLPVNTVSFNTYG